MSPVLLTRSHRWIGSHSRPRTSIWQTSSRRTGGQAVIWRSRLSSNASASVKSRLCRAAHRRGRDAADSIGSCTSFHEHHHEHEHRRLQFVGNRPSVATTLYISRTPVYGFTTPPPGSLFLSGVRVYAYSVHFSALTLRCAGFVV